jgi:WG containing repeat
VIPPQFEFAGSFSQGLARVQLRNRIGYIDKTGKLVISPQFDDAGSFSEGLATIYSNGKWGYISRD